MLNADYQRLSASGLVTLYELDATKLGAGVLRWHGHIGYEDWKLIDGATDPEKTYKNDIIWQGQVYEPVSIKSDGLEVRGDGKASSPKLLMANNVKGIQGGLSALCAQYDDFAGAKLTVINTMAKYLDAENFLEGNPDAGSEHKKQIWFIEQKTGENAYEVTFELSNPIDFEGVRIPTREITNYCHWAVHGQYRGEECGYLGVEYYNEKGEPVADPSQDKCGGRLSDCRLRFGKGEPLPFGGFPASTLAG